MDTQALEKLSAEQLAGLSDELKAVFCSLSSSDQEFFAKNMKPDQLPGALSRKSEIMKRNEASRLQIEEIKEQIARAVPQTSSTGDDIFAAAAGAVGVGAAAAVVATDHTAFYRGVKPSDLISPLRTEFSNTSTSVGVSGTPDVQTVTVYLNTDRERVPAMTTILSAVKDGTEVKVNDLTTQGILKTLQEGGQKLLGLAEKGLKLLRKKNPQDIIATASQTLDSGGDLADAVQNLKLKDRAWKVIHQTAEKIEAAYVDKIEKERQAQALLELAWDKYYNCPNCGVSFAPEDTTCRVCQSGRPESPKTPDPRQK